MTKRNPIKCLLLSLITLGIHDIVWFYQTRKELNALGADIPAFWHALVPFLSLVWMDKYCEGLHKVTQGRIKRYSAFFIILFLGSAGGAVIQYKLNQHTEFPSTTDNGIPRRWILGSVVLSLCIIIGISIGTAKIFESSVPDDSYIDTHDRSEWINYNTVKIIGTINNDHSTWSIQNVKIEAKALDIHDKVIKIFDIQVIPDNLAPGESGSYNQMISVSSSCEDVETFVGWEWVSP